MSGAGFAGHEAVLVFGASVGFVLITVAFVLPGLIRDLAFVLLRTPGKLATTLKRRFGGSVSGDNDAV